MAAASAHGGSKATVRLVPLNRPQSFVASLRARSIPAADFSLHHRKAQAFDLLEPAGARPGVRACVLGFVLPKRLCKHAVRRNLIRRVMRAELRAAMLAAVCWPADPPVLLLKLTRKLPETFLSAASPALSRYIRAQIQQLLHKTTERIARCAPPPGPSAQEVAA